MDECKLTIEKLDKALQGELSSKEYEELMAHLESGCEACEGFFAELPDEYEQALLFHAMAAESETDGSAQEDASLGKKRAIKAAVERSAELYGKKGGKGWNKVLPVAAMLVAAVAVGFFYVFGLADHDHHQNIKGPAMTAPADVSLRFLVVTPLENAGGKPAVKRGANHASLPPSASLMFRYRISRPAHIYLVKVGPGDSLKVLRYEEKERAGEYDVRDEPGFFTYPLADESGPVTFCAAAFHEEVTLQELEDRVLLAVTEYRKRRKGGVNENRIDCFEVEVDSWQGNSGPR